MFYTFILQAHSGWRWLVLLVLVVVTLKMVVGWLAKQTWADLDTTLMRVANWVVTIQVVLGVILYILVLFQGRPNLVAFTLSHALPAILALGGIGFAQARSRKAPTPQKFMFASIGLILTLVLVYGALRAVGGVFV